MVKITNKLGDVKTGRQGEVVYQRKYGEQIRRQVSPKRAMASEAQIKHRDLYRAALSWRKGLSLANRRYLDGYCLANWIVDDYNIALPWHRFALKLYLERVKFVVMERWTVTKEGELARYEYYTTGDTWHNYMRAGRWNAQSFTPSITHKIISVKLKLSRVGSPGTAIVGIRKTDGDGKPTGEDLCSETTDANTLTPDTGGEWREIDFGEGAVLNADTKYAIVSRAPDGDTNNYLRWRYDETAAEYEEGCFLLSNDGGSTWASSTEYDCMFEEWGKTIVAHEAATIHVRHPALATVVHKRGELTVSGYDKLSSLDDEYLTKQVGIDVEVGDTIEATTIAGIEYKYLVK